MDRSAATAEELCFRLHVEPGETVVVCLTGDVDPPDGPRLLELLLALLAVSRNELIIDLAGVGVFGSGGIQALEAASERAAAEGKSVVLRRPSERFRSILAAIGVDLRLEPPLPDRWRVGPGDPSGCSCAAG